jgi:transcriptional regulator with XRE-family HTH domain
MEIQKTIANKIRKLREIKGYSQEYMAIATEISQRQYQRLESGEHDMSLSRLERICTALDISTDQLFGFDEKFVFENCTNNTGMGKVTINNSPDQLISQFQDQIQHLKKEVAFLRNLLEK